MLVQTQVGPVATTTSIGAGTQIAQRSGQLGDTIVSELHGRYYETCYRRNFFYAATQSATATTVALATTYTGICISNPVGNTLNIVLNKVGIGLSVAPAAISVIGLMVGYNSSTNVTHTTPLTPASNFVGVGAAPTAKVDSSSTMPTAPTLAKVIMGGFTASSLPAVGPSVVDLEGSIVLPPGAYAAVYTLTAVTGLFSFFWEEIPV